MFLNDQAVDSMLPTSAGGALTFYELFDDPQLRSRGFSVQPEAGLLVAFPASTLHEVLPVTSGTRYSLVTWYL